MAAGRHFIVCAAFALALICLSGCLEVRVTQFFLPNGRSHIVQQVEVGSLLASLNYSGLSYGNRSGYAEWEKAFNDSCEKVSEVERGSNCHRAGSWFLIDQDRVSADEYVFTSFDQFPYTVYDLTILKVPVLPSSLLVNNSMVKYKSGVPFTNLSREVPLSLKSGGMDYTYVVHMPGEIYNYSSGRVIENGLEFNILDQAIKRKPVNIKSRVPNWGQIAIGVIFALDLFLGFDIGLMWLFQWAKKHREELSKLEQDAMQKAEEAKLSAKKSKLVGYQVYEFEKSGSISRIDEVVKKGQKK